MCNDNNSRSNFLKLPMMSVVKSFSVTPVIPFCFTLGLQPCKSSTDLILPRRPVGVSMAFISSWDAFRRSGKVPLHLLLLLLFSPLETISI